MLEFKILLGALAAIVALSAYAPYFWNTLTGKTKPHAFSWLAWGVLGSVAFAAQVAGKGGAGSWVTGFTAISCFVIFMLALVKGERRFAFFDWFCLMAAFVAIMLWYFTKTPLFSVILVTVADVIAFLPTFRKGYYRPHEETAATFALSGTKFFLSLLALETYTVTTWLYPASLVMTNSLFVTLLYMRRKQVAK